MSTEGRILFFNGREYYSLLRLSVRNIRDIPLTSIHHILFLNNQISRDSRIKVSKFKWKIWMKKVRSNANEKISEIPFQTMQCLYQDTSFKSEYAWVNNHLYIRQFWIQDKVSSEEMRCSGLYRVSVQCSPLLYIDYLLIFYMSKTIKTNAPAHPLTEPSPLKSFSWLSELYRMQKEFLIVQVPSMSPDILNEIKLLLSAYIPIACAAFVYPSFMESETDTLCGYLYK